MFPSFNPTVNNDCTGGSRTMGNNSNVENGSNGVKDRMRFLDCLVLFTRFWGIFTAIVLAGVGVDLVFHRHPTGYYLIGGSIFVFVSEVTWVATLFLQLCIRADHKFWKFWNVVTWFEQWKKTIIYAPMGGVPLLCPHKMWLSYLAAVQLFLLAIFHGLLSLRNRRRGKRKDLLIHSDIDSFDSSRFDEVTQVLDDGLPEPIPGSSHSLSDTLMDQSAIVEI